MKAGRNDPCPCGSGKKFKKCCESKMAKGSLASAQVLTGTQKMSSLFNRNIKPLSSPVPPAGPQEESSSDAQPQT